jgi:hypothetical protein
MPIQLKIKFKKGNPNIIAINKKNLLKGTGKEQ